MTASSLNLGAYRYRPARQLDETRMSMLWLANEVTRDSTNSPGSQVIIKIARMTEREYSLTNQRAIENEEKWLVRLDHPNVIRLRVVAERQSSQRAIYRARSELPGNPWFLVTDYLPGGDLQSVLSEHKKLPASLALEIAEQLCDALTYLHARNCVHCDIKPRNILFHERPAGYGLTETTRPILIDFGIAKNPTEGPQLASGTPRWITPELYQAMSVGRKIEVNATWDTYAAGLVLYTMVTGRKPELDNPGSHSWKPLTPADLAGDPTVKDAKQLADGLNHLIAGATADRIEERTAAAPLAEGVRALKQHVRKPGATTSPAHRSRQKQQRSAKGLWLALAGGVAALVLAGVLLLNDVIPGGSGQNGGATLSPAVSLAPTSAPAEGVAPPAATHTPTTKPTQRPTSTPLNTPTSTSPPSATPTRTSTPTPKPTATPTSTALAISPTAAVAASATPRPSIPTATLPLTPAAEPPSADTTPTSTPVPTSTSTALPTPTQTPPPQPTATPTPAEMRVTLTGPANNTNIDFNSQMTFSWQPSRPLSENECFEVVFWQGDASGWQNGQGIWDAGSQTVVRRVFNSDYEAASAFLEPGATYSWGVLLIEECQPYNGSSRKLISDVRTISYRK